MNTYGTTRCTLSCVWAQKIKKKNYMYFLGWLATWHTEFREKKSLQELKSENDQSFNTY